MALRLEDIIREKAKEQQVRKPSSVLQISAELKMDTRTELAKIAGVSHDTINSGMTYQAIAEVSGVDESTVRKSTSQSVNTVSEIQNTRGQKRPARYKPRQPCFCYRIC